MIIAFFRLFFKDEKCRQKHAEFRNELCVFLFALSIGRFRWMLKNILMRICLFKGFFFCNPDVYFFDMTHRTFRYQPSELPRLLLFHFITIQNPIGIVAVFQPDQLGE